MVVNMMKLFIFAAILTVTVPISFSAQAGEESMILFPKTREAYVAKSEEKAAKYISRGKDYVDHIYATGGETQSAPAEDFMMDVSILESEIVPVPVDVGQVADIVKSDGLAKEMPSGDKKTVVITP